MDLELSDKTALITGSERGTGTGIARVLASEGARVWIHGFDRPRAENVAEQLRQEGFRADAVAGDLRTDEGAAEVAAAVGRADVLVNNYGVAEGGSWESPTADWIDIYQKNVLSGVRLVQAMTPSMRERGWGRVIFISTVGYARPNSRMPHYYASKMALVNMTLSLAKELAHTGITVNCVSPGMIATAEMRAHLEKQAKKRGEPTDWPSLQALASQTLMPNPTGLIADPEDIGHFIAFLASDKARYINGANLRIDGGAGDSTH